jgi:hypothetical protein
MTLFRRLGKQFGRLTDKSHFRIIAAYTEKTDTEMNNSTQDTPDASTYQRRLISVLERASDLGLFGITVSQGHFRVRYLNSVPGTEYVQDLHFFQEDTRAMRDLEVVVAHEEAHRKYQAFRSETNRAARFL